MTTEQMNKEVAEWLGCIEYLSLMGGELYSHPDFSQGAGIIKLLELMMMKLPRKEFFKFIRKIGFGSSSDDYWYVYGVYLITPGKLLQAVWEWSKGIKIGT